MDHQLLPAKTISEINMQVRPEFQIAGRFVKLVRIQGLYVRLMGVTAKWGVLWFRGHVCVETV